MQLHHDSLMAFFADLAETMPFEPFSSPYFDAAALADERAHAVCCSQRIEFRLQRLILKKTTLIQVTATVFRYGKNIGEITTCHPYIHECEQAAAAHEEKVLSALAEEMVSLINDTI